MKTLIPPTGSFFLKKIFTAACILTFVSTSGLMAASLPLVSVTVSPSVIDRENLQSAQFTISLSAPAPHDIAVTFFMTGTARLNFDYALSGTFKDGKIVIPAGQTSTTVTLLPLRLDARFVRENALMNLVHDTQSVHTYSLGSPTRANVIIEVE